MADGVTTTYVITVLGLPHVLVETTGGQSTFYLHGHDGSTGPVLSVAEGLTAGLLALFCYFSGGPLAPGRL